MKRGILSGFLLLVFNLANASGPYNLSGKSFEGLNFSHLSSVFKHGHIVFQAGGYGSVQGKQQHININTLIGDDFTVTKPRGLNAIAGLGYFYNSKDLSQSQVLYGVNAYYLPRTSVSGTVVQESIFENLSYRYNLTHFPVYAAAKAIIPMANLAVTFDAGAGANFMQIKGFVEHSIDDGITIPDNIFAGQSATTLSGMLGIGLQMSKFFDETPLECGYRFFYLGKGNLLRSNSQVLNDLNTGSIFANAVVCTMYL